MDTNSEKLKGSRFRRFLYGLYRRYARFSGAIRRRLTPVGWMCVVLGVVSASVGVNTSMSPAYQLFTLLVALLVVAVIGNLGFRPQLRIRRRLPRFGSAGVPLTYQVSVENLGRRRYPALSLREHMTEPTPEREAFVREPEPGEITRNRFDRALLYYRWQWLVDQVRVVRQEDSPMFSLQPRSNANVPMQVEPLKRGVMRLEDMQIARTDRFGLLKALRLVPTERHETITVLPKRYPLPALRLGGRSRYQPAGSLAGGSVGQSDEFIGLREYRYGDPLRHLHWKSWARLGKPIVREFEDEFFPRYALALDTFAAYDRHNVFEEAVSVAASFAFALDTKESLLDLLFVGTDAYCFTSGRGVSQPERLLEVLAAVELCREKPFTDLDMLIQGHVRDLSTCICVFIEWNDERERCLKRLQGQGVDILALVITPPGEDTPPKTAFEGVHFLDSTRVAEGLARL